MNQSSSRILQVIVADAAQRAAEQATDRRRHQRLPTSWAGTMHFGAAAIDGAIANISASGALVLAEHDLREDMLVILRIESFGYLPARVVWTQNDRVGLQFLDTPQRVAQLLGLSDLIRRAADVELMPF
jgi:hypothetical protein